MGVTRCEAEDELRTDETLFLYTDGLIERRNRAIDGMLDQLLGVVERSSASTPSRLVESVLDDLLSGVSQEDDVCVLALRRVGTRSFATTFPASPKEITKLRHGLDDWLGELGVELDRRRDLVLAVSEAAANAAEHAYRFDGVGLVQVKVRRDESGSLYASISDAGQWRAPAPDARRGRGTRIIQALMDEISIQSGRGGTVVRMRLPAKEGMPT
jgi:anti-sigma regulatory factor (Ser/Thr protein kinase)